jgi:geranylgeranyl reductase family protein
MVIKKNYDVIISGAGPAGSLLGFLLSSNKINTLIIEKKEFPRQKTCAGGVQHRVLGLIPFDIGSLIERKINSIRFSHNQKDCFEKENPKPFMYTVQRAELDDFMAKKARGSGCGIVFGEHIKELSVSEELVELKTASGSYSAKIVVGADGANGFIHNLLAGGGGYTKTIGYESEIGLDKLQKESVLQDALKGKIFVDFGNVKKGYLWVFPKKSSFSVGSGGPFKSSIKIKEYLKGYLFDNGFRNQFINAHFIPVGNKKVQISSRRVICIGDAACLVDGFTGEGLYNALKSSHIAHDFILKTFKRNGHDYQGYSDIINHEIISDIKASLIFSKIFFSSFFFYYKLLKSNDVFFSTCCKILRGENTYKSILGRNVLKLRL